MHITNKKRKLLSPQNSFPSQNLPKITTGLENSAQSVGRQLLLMRKAAVSVILVDIASVNDGGE